MEVTRKKAALRKVLGEEERAKGDELIFVCPKEGCRKDKAKLSVNVKTDRFHCWICNWGGNNLSGILRLKGQSQEYKEYISSLLPQKSESLKKYSIPSLPREYRSLSKNWNSLYYRAALNYLSDRGIGIKEILKYKLGYCEDGDYRYRVICPSFDEYGLLNFSVGRSFYENSQKYKHDNLNKDIIFNEYLVDWSSPIVITEGPFDAMKAENAVPLLGSIIREDSALFRKIVLAGVDVYFALDSDALEKQMNIMEMFFSFGVRVHFVDLMGKKDLGEMSPAEFVVARSRAVKIDSSLDLLKMRVMA